MHSSLHSSPCSAWLCSSFPLFHSATAMWLHHVSLLLLGYAWCMPLTHAATYLDYVGTHWLDPIHTCTYTTSSIKGCKCQPENFSLVLLVFPHDSQSEHLLNQLLAPSVSPTFFDSLEHQLMLLPLGCFSCCLSSDVAGPEDVSCMVWPLSDVAVTCLDERVSYGSV